MRHPFAAMIFGYVAFALAFDMAREWRAARDARAFESFRKAFDLPAVRPDPEDKLPDDIPATDVRARLDRVTGV